MENEIKKLTESEMSSIKKIQEDLQDIIFKFGQITMERLSVEESLKEIKELESKTKQEYIEIQKRESALMDELVNKYGDGKLSLKDGTFISS